MRLMLVIYLFNKVISKVELPVSIVWQKRGEYIMKEEVSQDTLTAEERNRYYDLDELTYPKNVVHFLRKQLDDFAITCFKSVLFSGNEGILKTKIDDYLKHRKHYDLAFLTLEKQGFIEQRKFGNMRPYVITKRGKQLAQYLAEEKARNQQNQ